MAKQPEKALLKKKKTAHSDLSSNLELPTPTGYSAEQVFIDPTFFGIFVCPPLQSFVVYVHS